MTNLAVGYSRPALALSTLTSELRTKYGNPDRTYEYVTGYDRSGITSHNADANGVAHAVDIFVGPGNLTEAQGITVAEQLRQDGTRGTIPGHPDRLAYIIHRGRIAGDHTDWDWIPYTGPDWHGDHIHVSSVFDYYWGDPVAGNPADYDSTLTWGLGTYTTQGSRPIPIPPTLEDTLAKLDKEDLDNIAKAVWSYNGTKQRTDMHGRLTELWRDLQQGVAGKNSDGDSFNLIRSIAAKLGVPVDETARRKKVTGK